MLISDSVCNTLRVVMRVLRTFCQHCLFLAPAAFGPLKRQEKLYLGPPQYRKKVSHFCHLELRDADEAQVIDTPSIRGLKSPMRSQTGIKCKVSVPLSSFIPDSQPTSTLGSAPYPDSIYYPLLVHFNTVETRPPVIVQCTPSFLKCRISTPPQARTMGQQRRQLLPHNTKPMTFKPTKLSPPHPPPIKKINQSSFLVSPPLTFSYKCHLVEPSTNSNIRINQPLFHKILLPLRPLLPTFSLYA